ncbi:hypothetical protein [Herbaspirillum sp. alder98]|uniref:hypothetical protein n=1 Tax=Herbaspirillum sp. alder98 TaxID=2913096 RepID=UPI001CD8CD1C|nr:hypothetical protein [Herbaspirillum sp. alder98]MCA1323771.1 hypothetical protein [Herbaspirillum sp. alder98]
MSDKIKTVLVIGATGSIGRLVVEGDRSGFFGARADPGCAPGTSHTAQPGAVA